MYILIPMLTPERRPTEYELDIIAARRRVQTIPRPSLRERFALAVTVFRFPERVMRSEDCAA